MSYLCAAFLDVSKTNKIRNKRFKLKGNQTFNIHNAIKDVLSIKTNNEEYVLCFLIFEKQQMSFLLNKDCIIHENPFDLVWLKPRMQSFESMGYIKLFVIDLDAEKHKFIKNV